MTADEAVETLKEVECILSAKVLEAEPMCDEVPVLLGSVRVVLKIEDLTAEENDTEEDIEWMYGRNSGREETLIALATELKALLPTKGEE